MTSKVKRNVQVNKLNSEMSGVDASNKNLISGSKAKSALRMEKSVCWACNSVVIRFSGKRKNFKSLSTVASAMVVTYNSWTGMKALTFTGPSTCNSSQSTVPLVNSVTAKLFSLLSIWPRSYSMTRDATNFISRSSNPIWPSRIALSSSISRCRRHGSTGMRSFVGRRSRMRRALRLGGVPSICKYSSWLNRVR